MLTKAQTREDSSITSLNDNEIAQVSGGPVLVYVRVDVYSSNGTYMGYYLQPTWMSEMDAALRNNDTV